MALAVVGLDYAVAPYVRFPILYLLPIAFASWYCGVWPGLLLAVTMPSIRFAFLTTMDRPWTLSQAAVNGSIRIVVFVLFALMLARIARQNAQLTQEVRTLAGLLHMCTFCKKIRTSEGEWQSIDRYISAHTESRISHGLCPACAHEHYGDVLHESGTPPAKRSKPS